MIKNKTKKKSNGTTGENYDGTHTGNCFAYLTRRITHFIICTYLKRNLNYINTFIIDYLTNLITQILI